MSLLFTSRWGRRQALNSECGIGLADFTDWMTNHLTSCKKPALMWRLSAQISKTIHQHGKAEKTKII